MCQYCFDVLLSKFDSNYTSKLQIPSHWLTTKYPLFVTWEKSGKLRGCIGTFKPDTLKTNLEVYAIQAAFHDSRFSPIKKHEVPMLTCEVNLLIDFEDAANIWDWEIGTHGIIISYGSYRATYLPSVAPDQGWNKQQTIKNLARKSGYSGPIANFKLRRYKSSKASLSYNKETSNKNVPLKWEIPFQLSFQVNSSIYMLSQKSNFYMGNHIINNQKFTSVLFNLNKGKVLFLTSPTELHYFDVDVKKILKEQSLMENIQMIIPKFAWSFSGKVMYFNSMGIFDYEISEPLSETPKETNTKFYNMSKEFFCLVLDDQDEILYSDVVFDYFNPWKSNKQRRAIYAKMKRARGKNKKYYKRMIKKWDKY